MSRSGRGLNGAPSLCSGSLVGEEKSKGVATGTSDQMHRGSRLILPHPEHAPVVSTLDPTHHRATKALASIASAK
jgi:hypothetical protein